MVIDLVPTPEPEVVAAARRAAEDVGAAGPPSRAQVRWWRAGIEEALADRAVRPTRGAVYEVAPSPRSTRGATRA